MLVSERIEPKDLETFEKLIPKALHEQIRTEDLFAVASFDVSTVDTPLVGVVVLGAVEFWVQIVWYVLMPGYDTPDYLADMLRERVMDAMAGGEAEGVYAVLPDIKERQMDAQAFVCEGFELVDSKSHVVSFTLNNLKTDRLPEIAEADGFIALEKADERMRRTLANHMANDPRNVPVEIPVRWDLYDPSLSILRLEGDVPIGVSLVRIRDGNAYVELVYESEPKDFLRMLAVLIRKGLNTLDGSTQVIVPVIDERIFEVLKVIAPDAERVSQRKAYLRFDRE